MNERIYARMNECGKHRLQLAWVGSDCCSVCIGSLQEVRGGLAATLLLTTLLQKVGCLELPCPH